MSIIYTINNKVIKNRSNNKWLKKYDPFNPLGLPANTIRVKFSSGYTPTMGDTQTLVDSNNNIWNIYKESNDWSNLFNGLTYGNRIVLEVLGANTSNVTNMSSLFKYCYSLSVVPLFDTSNVTKMSSMFDNCESITSVPLFNTSKVTKLDSTFAYCKELTSIPLFDTSKVTDISYIFYYCRKVESGALALYQQASSQSTPPSNHTYAFKNCGSSTVAGAAELAQIPSDWK